MEELYGNPFTCYVSRINYNLQFLLLEFILLWSQDLLVSNSLLFFSLFLHTVQKWSVIPFFSQVNFVPWLCKIWELRLSRNPGSTCLQFGWTLKIRLKEPCGHLHWRCLEWNSAKEQTQQCRDNSEQMKWSKLLLHCAGSCMTFQKLLPWCTNQMFCCAEESSTLHPPNSSGNITNQYSWR